MPRPPTLEALAEAVQRLQEAFLNTPRLHRKDIEARYGIAKSTFYRLLSKGKLPRPIRLAGPVWRLEDIEAAEKAGQLPCPANPPRKSSF